MSNFKEQYKNPCPGFGDTDTRRYLRAYNYDKTRREARTRNFDKNRNLGALTPTNSQLEDISSITDERRKKLIKWKEEKNRRKRQEATKKKPTFKVGVVHHSLCSPILKNKTLTAKPLKINETSKSFHVTKQGLTRATLKRLRAKEAAAAAAGPNGKNQTALLNKSERVNKQITKIKKEGASFAPVGHCFKPPSGLEEIPLFGTVMIKQMPHKRSPSAQECIQTSNNTSKNSRTSLNLRLSLNKQNSSQKLNKSSINQLDGLNVKKKKSSLKGQIINHADKRDSLQKNMSSSSIASNTKTPPLKTTASTSLEKENCSTEDLISFSPYLVRSRGKNNSRKEGQQRLGIGRRSDEIPTKDTIMQNLNICVEEEERTAQYFKFLLNKETDRLKELCNKWQEIASTKDIPEDAIYEIQQAVGQTNLLINKKFQRFRSLVQDCETGKGEMLVTCRDLQGFWDMTYMEVKDCDMRFEKLQQSQSRGWHEDEYAVTEIKPVIKKRMSNKKQNVSSKPSTLRSLILAARKNKIKTEPLNEEMSLQDVLNDKKSVIVNVHENSRNNKRRSKSYNFTETERKSLSQSEHLKVKSISSSVQYPDKLKKLRSPFAAMKISQMCKTPEIQLDDTISYVNSDQTPGKSILKKKEELEKKETRIKSTHKVNFDDEVILTNLPVDEKMQSASNLSVTLTRIEDSDLNKLNESPCISVERKLDFEGDEFNTTYNLEESITQTIDKHNKSKSLIQSTSDDTVQLLNNVTYTVPTTESSLNNMEITSPSKNLRKRNRRSNTSSRKTLNIHHSPPIQGNEGDEIVVTPEIILNDVKDLDLGRVLRNRTIYSTSNTPKSATNMMTPKRQSVNKEKNQDSVKLNRKRSLRRSERGENIKLDENNTVEMENHTMINNTRKKSLRKSVAFTETCVACVENKPVLPMTPYSVRRSKTPSRQSRSKQAIEEDLILWDTPNKNYPRRVTRSKLNNS
ncbi:hypothetical protein PUN28_007476 [Cardiocondyla obscurior]|uniref:Disks large-associated protein 5 n=1 Tax=Cardiocondyla obscurior TaxID=286306 RepID=A0AAW2G9B4_9HYME